MPEPRRLVVSAKRLAGSAPGGRAGSNAPPRGAGVRQSQFAKPYSPAPASASPARPPRWYEDAPKKRKASADPAAARRTVVLVAVAVGVLAVVGVIVAAAVSSQRKPARVFVEAEPPPPPAPPVPSPGRGPRTYAELGGLTMGEYMRQHPAESEELKARRERMRQSGARPSR